jgi:hypothetical protein
MKPHNLVEDNLAALRIADHPLLAALLEKITAQYGESLAAVLIYGSYTRGKRDTLLDFYVLLDHHRSMPRAWHGLACMLLPPNVYHIHVGSGAEAVYAKCAVLTTSRFQRAMRSDFHSYFWARFAQPCAMLYCRDEAAKAQLVAACVDAASTFVRRALPLMDANFSSQTLWREGLRRTYQCELRSENQQHIDSLLEASGDYFHAMSLALAEGELAYQGGRENDFSHQPSTAARVLARISWSLRRVQGKFLSAARLLKAALTFEDALGYLLWKIERHTGIKAEASERQHRYPLLFAWPLLWRLYRQGAFR